MSHQHNSTSNGHGPAKGLPVPAHDLSGGGAGGGGLGGSQVNVNQPYGANPGPGWSQHVGPAHKAPAPVATQLVVPSELNDSPVTLTCFNCQHHVTTATKTGPSTLSWGLCLCMCLCVCWPCCLVPFCCHPLNVTEHYCPNCNILLGKYKGWKK